MKSAYLLKKLIWIVFLADRLNIDGATKAVPDYSLRDKRRA
jgi:hypothetical protein